MLHLFYICYNNDLDFIILCLRKFWNFEPSDLY